MCQTISLNKLISMASETMTLIFVADTRFHVWVYEETEQWIAAHPLGVFICYYECSQHNIFL